MRYMWAVAAAVMAIGLPIAASADEGRTFAGVGTSYGGVGLHHEFAGGGRVTAGGGIGLLGLSGNLNLYLTDRQDSVGNSEGSRIRLTAGVFWLIETELGDLALTVGSATDRLDWGVGIGVVGIIDGESTVFPAAYLGYRL